MKGQMKVKKLNDTGLYISEMDWDNTYICKENPIGNFVMVIEPLSDFDVRGFPEEYISAICSG